MFLHGCGFRLKGTTPLPFQQLYTNISKHSAFGAELQRILKADSPNLQFVNDREQAQASLIQLENRRRTREVSLDPQGNVEEYQLNIYFRFELLDEHRRHIIPATSLTVSRFLPNDPDSVQAKESERAQLYASMERDLIERIARRLTAPDVTKRFEELVTEEPQSETETKLEEAILPDDEYEEEFLPVFNF